MNLEERIKKVRALILDVDGVLTDGRIIYNGAEEWKCFNVRDGHGIKLAMRAGIKVGMLSGRCAKANRKRAEELKMDFVYEGEKDKLAAFSRLLEEQRLSAGECMYIGDDVVDMPVMQRCAVAVAVGDAAAELDECCDLRTQADGGRGAVREAIEWLLRRQGKWEKLMEKYRA